MGAAIFGSEFVPDITDTDRASRVNLALRIAKLILTSGDLGEFDAFFIACAVAVKRVDTKRLRKRARKESSRERGKVGSGDGKA